MKRFIEFGTGYDQKASEFIGGNPVHDGRVPAARREVEAVRIDGEPVSFQDPEMTERIHRAMLDAEAIHNRGYLVDAVVLVALMNSVELELATRRHAQNHDGQGLFEFDIKKGNELGRDEAVPSASDLALYAQYHDRNRFFRTMLHPAHFEDGANYISKLGSAGPIAMAPLEAFARGYQTNITVAVESIGLKE